MLVAKPWPDVTLQPGYHFLHGRAQSRVDIHAAAVPMHAVVAAARSCQDLRQYPDKKVVLASPDPKVVHSSIVDARMAHCMRLALSAAHVMVGSMGPASPYTNALASLNKSTPRSPAPNASTGWSTPRGPPVLSPVRRCSIPRAAVPSVSPIRRCDLPQAVRVMSPCRVQVTPPLLHACAATAATLPRKIVCPTIGERHDPIISSFDIEGIAKYIKEHECKRVVVMCGAGISTSAGIPDFRSPGTGLYANLQKYNLPTPESIFQMSYFRKNPRAFYELAKEMWPGNYDPTLAHYFVKMLDSKGILLRCYTQNIDSLENRSGLPKEKVIAAHGNFDSAHVIDTHPEVQVDINELKAAIDNGEAGWQELRRRRGNLVKPKIVFFGEGLPRYFLDQHKKDMEQCDLLIVLGTSLVVAPFNSLVGLAPPSAPRLFVNRDKAGTCDMLKNGFRYAVKDGSNVKDAWHKGSCDDGCRALAEALGWTKDLDQLVVSKGRASIRRAPWMSKQRL